MVRILFNIMPLFSFDLSKKNKNERTVEATFFIILLSDYSPFDYIVLFTVESIPLKDVIEFSSRTKR